MGRGGFGYNPIIHATKTEWLAFTEGYNNLYVGKYDSETNSYSTKNFYFSLSACYATSYGWWKFVARGKDGTIYFNKHRYSNSTSAHQDMALTILYIEGAEIECVDVAKGLSEAGLRYAISTLRDTELSIRMQLQKGSLDETRTEKKEVN